MSDDDQTNKQVRERARADRAGRSTAARPSAKARKVAKGTVRTASRGRVQPASKAADDIRSKASDGAQALLAQLPVPPWALAVACVTVIVLALGLSTALRGCRAEDPAPDGASAEAAAVPQEPVVGTGVNPNQPVSLSWRDSDFAVNPAFRDWSTDDNGRKVVYLTIDDGPSELTEQFLDLLDEYGAKATFFVTGHDPQYYGMIQEAYNRGHTIGLHTMTHDYAQVYASEDAFYEDLAAVAQVVKDQLGYIPCFIRFPGGSSNSQAVEQSKSKDIMKNLTAGVIARGYQYYDWSLSSGDGANLSKKDIIAQSTAENGSAVDPTKDTNIILLCHDSATKQATLEALPTIIEHYQSQGYTFEAIDRKTWVCHHAIFVDDEDDEAQVDEGNEESEAQAA